MIKKFVAAAVVSGTLAIGAGAGMASAATTGNTGSTPATHTVNCAKAPQLLARIEARQQKAQARLPKLQAALAKAQAAGRATRADRIQRLINRVQTFLARAPQRIQKIESACPGVQPASGSSSSAS